MKKIKLALIYSSSEFGGMVTNLAKIINCLDRENFEVLLISLEQNNPVATLLDPKFNTKLVELNCRGRIDLKVITKLRQVLIAEKISLISLHGYKANFYGLISSISLKLKKISTIHGWVSQSWKLKFYQLIDRITLLFFDAIILVSPAQIIRHPLLKLLGSKINVIVNAIDIDEMKLSREETLLKESDLVILGVCSRLAVEKRINIIISACAELKETNWKLLIIGEGEERAKLEMLRDSLGLSQKIMFLGYKTNVKPYLHHFDIFISASQIEGLPNSLLEAGACDCAVIVSDITEHLSVIEDKIDGLSFPLDHAKILALRISSLIENRSQREQLAKNFKQKLSEKFTIKERKKKLNALFLKIGTSSAN